MHRRSIFSLTVFLLVLVTVLPSTAQERLSSAEVEQKSYELYLQKNWIGLEHFGRTALSQGFDYYYLRLRLGIAYYEQKNYLTAQVHFRRALSFSSGDPLALEYLYYSYLFTGRQEEARTLSKTFPEALARRIGTDTLGALGFVMLEGGAKNSDSTRLYQSSWYFQLGLGHFVKNRISLFHAATFSMETDLVGNTTQIQYYLKAGIPMKNGWMFSPAFQVIHRDFTPTPPPPGKPKPPPFPGMPSPPPPPQTQPADVINNFIVGSFALRKTVSTLDITLGTAVSNIDSNGQINHSLALTWYPLGNSRLSATCIGYVYSSDWYQTFHTALNPGIAVMPFKRLYLSAAYLICNGNNLVEGNGYIVNNRPDPTIARWSYLASISLGKHLDVYALYQIEDKKEYTKDFTYHYNLIVAGLKIKP